mgnify:CR=1 FL=1
MTELRDRTTEAKKSGGVGVLYGLCALLFGGIAIGLRQYGALRLSTCIVCALASLGIFIDWLLTPPRPFRIDGDGRLVLHDGTALEMRQVLAVSYRRARARGVQYRWGTVTVTTPLKIYRYRYVADCESMADAIMQRKAAAQTHPPDA